MLIKVKIIFITHAGGLNEKNISTFADVAEKVIILCFQKHLEKQKKRVSLISEEQKKRVSLIPVRNIPHCLITALRYCKKEDAVGGQDPISGFIAAVAAKLKGKRSFMMYCQDFLEYFYVANPPFFRRVIYGKLLEAILFLTCRYSVVFPLSRYTELSAKRRGGRAVFAVPTYGVNTQRFKPAKKPADLIKKYSLAEQKVLLCTSRMSPEKGVPYVVSAFVQLLQKYPDIRLVLAGYGMNMQALSSKVQDLHLEKEIIFTGFIDFQEMHRYYQLCDIFIMPSLKEGLGFAALEALACEKPVVASRVGGIVDGVPEDIGFLVPPANADAIIKAVTFIFEKGDKLRERLKKGRAHVIKNFEEKQAFEKLKYHLEKDVLQKQPSADLTSENDFGLSKVSGLNER